MVITTTNKTTTRITTIRTTSRINGNNLNNSSTICSSSINSHSTSNKRSINNDVETFISNEKPLNKRAIVDLANEYVAYNTLIKMMTTIR
tara:strand:+ start:251 stop:520 length:270 start_codon:yes stop_codon:yes gene_type:complete